MRKTKKGIVIFSAKFILGVIVLVLLIILLFKVFSLFTEESDKQKAKATLAEIKRAIENAEQESEVRSIILNPKGWYLLSKEDPSLNDFCQKGRCICLCPKNNVLDCLKKAEGICETLEEKVSNSGGNPLAFEISAVPFPMTIKYFRDEDIFRFYNVDFISIPPGAITLLEFQGKKYIEGIDVTFPGTTIIAYPNDKPEIMRGIISSNEKGNSLLAWNPREYTNFPQTLLEESNSNEVNPLLVFSILQNQHRITDQVEKALQLNKPRVYGIIEVKKEVFARAQQLLPKDDFEKNCKEPDISYGKTVENEQNSQKAFNDYSKAAISCLAGTLAQLKKQKTPSEVLQIYASDQEKVKQIWKDFIWYTH